MSWNWIRCPTVTLKGIKLQIWQFYEKRPIVRPKHVYFILYQGINSVVDTASFGKAIYKQLEVMWKEAMCCNWK